MTERERDDVPSDEAIEEPAADDELDAAADDELDDLPVEPDSREQLGDPNDAIPTSGATPGTIGAGAAGRTGRAGRGSRRASAPVKSAAPTPSEVAVHIDDRVSMAFVGLVVGVFVLIFLYGIFLGDNGVFTPRATPIPPPTAAPSVSAAPSASPSAAPSASGSASASPSASAGASPSASAAPSASPAPSSS